jgi:ABC-type arginine/histidine transport system permease subunit
MMKTVRCITLALMLLPAMASSANELMLVDKGQSLTPIVVFKDAP